MIKLSFRFLCCLFFILTPLAQAHAQFVSSWFRGTAQSWKLLTETSFSAARLSATRLITPMSGLVTGSAVKTTVPNWLRHRLSHSGTFSAAEKNILTVHPANPTAVTGKLSYLWDKNALLAANASAGEINEKAFLRHQQLLQNTLAEVENFSREQLSAHFYSAIFSKEEIFRSLKDPFQPQPFILTRREVEQFSQLSLPEQRTFAHRAWYHATVKLSELQLQNLQKLSTQAYSDYYYFKLRQRYFAALYQAVRDAATPRKTIIIRIRRKIPLDFLPESDRALTDAQRLGKLHFHLERLKKGTTDMDEKVALKAEIVRQTELYHPYALAEAFGLPYEDVLKTPIQNASFYFTKKEADELNLLTSQQAVDELPAKIARIQTHMETLLGEKNPSLEDYVYYFRLYAREQFLQTRLARAKFFLQHLP